MNKIKNPNDTPVFLDISLIVDKYDTDTVSLEIQHPDGTLWGVKFSKDGFRKFRDHVNNCPVP